MGKDESKSDVGLAHSFGWQHLPFAHSFETPCQAFATVDYCVPYAPTQECDVAVLGGTVCSDGYHFSHH